MKKSIQNFLLSFSFLFFTVVSFGQVIEGIAMVTDHVPPVYEIETSPSPVITNVQQPLDEVREYLKANVEIPDYLLDVYNNDITVFASFFINTAGEIEGVSISRKSDAMLGRIVKANLEALKSVTPVVENGKIIEQYVSIPVVFQMK